MELTEEEDIKVQYLFREQGWNRSRATNHVLQRRKQLRISDY